MSNAYAQACTEVLEILNSLSTEEINKISQEKMDFYRKHKDKDYIFEYDSGKTLKEQAVSKEAEAIIVTIFRDYFATDIQKEKLKNILMQNDYKKQNKLTEEYNPDNLFKEKHKSLEIEQTQTKNVAIIEYKKEKIFSKVLDIIKSILRIK